MASYPWHEIQDITGGYGIDGFRATIKITLESGIEVIFRDTYKMSEEEKDLIDRLSPRRDDWESNPIDIFQDSILTTKIIDGYGWAPAAGARAKVCIKSPNLVIRQYSASAIEIPFMEVTSFSLEEFAAETGLKFAGGGFGIKGALEGIVAAGILNSLSSRVEKFVVLKLDTASGGCQMVIPNVWGLAMRQYFRPLRNALSERPAAPSVIAGKLSESDSISQLSLLASLLDRKLISKSEFEYLKKQIFVIK